jgi:hypothetical protein
MTKINDKALNDSSDNKFLTDVKYDNKNIKTHANNNTLSTNNNENLNTFYTHSHITRFFVLPIIEVNALVIKNCLYGIYTTVDKIIQVISDGSLLKSSNLNNNYISIGKPILITNFSESIGMVVKLRKELLHQQSNLNVQSNNTEKRPTKKATTIVTIQI